MFFYKLDEKRTDMDIELGRRRALAAKNTDENIVNI